MIMHLHKIKVQPIAKRKNTLFIPSAHILYPRCPVSATPTHMLRICVNSPVSATPTHMLRICVNSRHALSAGVRNNACTNLLGFFVRYVRTRGIAETTESATLQISALPFVALT